MMKIKRELLNNPRQSKTKGKEIFFFLLLDTTTGDL